MDFTSFVVLCSWIIFYFTDMSQLIYMFRIMFGLSNRPLNDIFINLTINEYLTYLVLGVIGSIPLSKFVKQISEKIYNRNRLGQGSVVTVQVIFMLVVLLLSSAMLVASSYNPFLYFRF